MLENFRDQSQSSTDGLLKSILESAIYGIMNLRTIRDQDGEIVDFEWQFVNKVAADILLHAIEQLEGNRLLDLLPSNRETGLFDRYKKVVNTGQSDLFELKIDRNDGYQWFRISAVKMDDGVTVTFQETTNLKEAILEVKTEENKYQRLIEESIDAIFQMDDSFMFSEANQAWMHLFGYPSFHENQMVIEDLFLDKQQYDDFQNELKRTSRVEEMEVMLLNSESKKKPCLINCVKISLHEKKEDIYLGVIRDMTKRNQSDWQLLQAEKLSVTGKIARTIAHEIRNPLTNLTLALEQLKEEVPADVEDSDLYFEIIERNAGRIGNLITDLLNSSKPKALVLESQSLNEVIQQALTLVQDRIKLNNMELVVDFQSDLPEVMLDADQMKVAILNLLINALEAMENGKGTLNVTTKLTESGTQLLIQDNGKGMNAEEINLLFEPYYTGKLEGTGLGLTTVQNIIHSHQGKIDVESEVNQGTLFKITFDQS